MVLQITANPGQVMNHLDADVAKRRRRADAGQLEQLRGADGAGRQHHLATGRGVHRPAVTPKSTPTTRPSRITRRAACDLVITVKLARPRAGFRKPLAVLPRTPFFWLT